MAEVTEVLITVERLDRTGSITFESPAISHPGGVGFSIASFDGWDSAPSMRGFAEAWPTGHGETYGARFMNPRVVQWEGTLEAQNQMDFEDAALNFSGLLAEGDSARVTVQKPGQTLWAVGVAEKFELVPTGYEPDGQYGVQMLFHDPRKYGEQQKITVPSSGTVDLPNWGSLHAWPKVTVTAASATPGGYALRLFNDAGTSIGYWRIQAPLTAGQSHVLDFKRAQVRRSGALQWSAVHSGSPWAIPRGRISKMQFEYPGAGACTGVVEYANPYG